MSIAHTRYYTAVCTRVINRPEARVVVGVFGTPRGGLGGLEGLREADTRATASRKGAAGLYCLQHARAARPKVSSKMLFFRLVLTVSLN